MLIHGYKIIVNGSEQLLYYFLLPKSSGDLLNVNMPLIVDEKVDEWMSSNNTVDIFLDAMNNKYTFKNSVVDREVRCNNRYGVPCRDVYIKYGVMLNRYQKGNK
jgi:hypothetical protein